jgi:hypothetical protein
MNSEGIDAYLDSVQAKVNALPALCSSGRLPTRSIGLLRNLQIRR